MTFNLRVKLLGPIIVVFVILVLTLHFYWRPLMLEHQEADVIKEEKDMLHHIEPDLLRSLKVGDLGAVYLTLNHLQEINKNYYVIEAFNAQGLRIYPFSEPEQLTSPYIISQKLPLISAQHLLGVLYVQADWSTRYKETEKNLLLIELLICALFGLIFVFIIIFQDLFIRRPLIAIKDASKRLADGEFNVTLPVHSRDEIGELADAFLHMKCRLLESQKSLQAQVIEAERANKVKSEFLSRMSHELRTPMNAILGFGQLLELDRAKLNEMQNDNVKEIMHASYHLLNLINEVLDLAKIESGKMQCQIDTILLNDVLIDCLVMVKSQADARQIEIINNISHHYYVQADLNRLKQVFINLLSNAIKYNTEQGSITLDARLIAEHCLRISVSDTGVGLTEENIVHLFSPFERFNTAQNVEGTGIGLTITKCLVELMQGKIGVQSTPGKGSTFWIELPVPAKKPD